MALTITAIGNGTHAASSLTCALTTTVAAAIGDLVAVRYLQSNGGSTHTLSSVTDSAGNVYTRATRADSTTGGQDSEIWYSVLTATLAIGATITATAASTVVNTVVYADKVTGGSNMILRSSVATKAASGTTGQGTMATLVGDACFGNVIATINVTTVTNPATWTQEFNGVVGSASNIALISQKVTALTTTSFAPSFSGGSADYNSMSCAAFGPAPPANGQFLQFF